MRKIMALLIVSLFLLSTISVQILAKEGEYNEKNMGDRKVIEQIMEKTNIEAKERMRAEIKKEGMIDNLERCKNDLSENTDLSEEDINNKCKFRTMIKSRTAPKVM